MKSWQKAIKYLAIALAVFICVAICAGIVRILAVTSNFFDSKDIVGEMKAYDVFEGIKELDLDVGAGQLVITEGDAFSVKSNNKYLQVTERGSCLVISDKEHVYTGSNVGKIKVEITISENTVFNSATLKTGAGVVEIDSLTADNLRLDLGAGQVTAQSLIANRSCKINGGAGQITVNGGSLYNLDLDMGVGELRLTSSLQGDCDLDMDVGAAYITLLGSEADYRIKLDKGLGEATLDGKKLQNGDKIGNGINEVEIEGGVGEVRIEFAKSSAEKELI